MINPFQRIWLFLLSFFKKDNNSKSKLLVKKQHKLDKQLILDLSKTKFPKLKQFKYLSKVLSKKEYRLVKLLSFLIFICLVFLGTKGYFVYSQIVPKDGGEYTEALIGSPLYVNPILSQTNDVDSDLSFLIYSGLLKYNAQQEIVPDLASDYKISEDQKTYTFSLKENIKWHDGRDLTVDDIIFTVDSIENSDYKSPLAISFKGVEAIKIDNQTIKFTLREAYTPFIEVLTFGILPQHIWQQIEPTKTHLAEYNLKPIGSGPFKFESFTKDRLGNIKSYTLIRNNDYYAKKPHLKKLVFKFYPDFKEAITAIKNSNVAGVSFLPKRLKSDLEKEKSLNFHLLRLPQYTAIFFNQKNNPVLKEKKIRQALALGVDRDKIIEEVLNHEGEIINGPILPGFVGYNPDIEKFNYDPIKAAEILDKLEWEKITQKKYLEIEEIKRIKKAEEAKKNEENKSETKDITIAKETVEGENSAETPAPNDFAPSIFQERPPKLEQKLLEFYRQKENEILTISLTTVDNPENLRAAEIIAENWGEIGVRVNIKIVAGSKIQKEIIKPRDYEAFLYGIIVRSDPDPYPFWHSSQNKHPGLNLSVFNNKEVDKLLEDTRKMTNLELRHRKYLHFQNILVAELPAIFLYNPTYTYVMDKRIKGFNIERIAVPYDRFANIEDWYLKTRRVFWEK